MEVLMWYAIFAIATSMTSMYEIFVPVVRSLEKTNPKNNVVTYKYVTYITFFILSLLVAPLILPSCIIPSFGERFKTSLLKSLSQN